MTEFTIIDKKDLQKLSDENARLMTEVGVLQGRLAGIEKRFGLNPELEIKEKQDFDIATEKITDLESNLNLLETKTKEITAISEKVDNHENRIKKIESGSIITPPVPVDETGGDTIKTY